MRAVPNSLQSFLFLFFLWVLVPYAHASWQTLDGARLIPAGGNDGDSFRVEHKGTTYIFRLYGADCPETDMSFPDRVNEQAAEFGVEVDDAVGWGHAAARRAKEILASPFRVVTRWDDALGRSSIPRHYAYILPAGGGDLAASLLSEGLARARGRHPALPMGFPRVGNGAEYQSAQDGARRARRGIWGDSTASGKPAETKPVVRWSSDGKINVNTDSAQQLEALPGVGSVLAERIVAHRPYYKESDLLRVPGIGDEKLRQISGKIGF